MHLIIFLHNLPSRRDEEGAVVVARRGVALAIRASDQEMRLRLHREVEDPSCQRPPLPEEKRNGGLWPHDEVRPPVCPAGQTIINADRPARESRGPLDPPLAIPPADPYPHLPP